MITAPQAHPPLTWPECWSQFPLPSSHSGRYLQFYLSLASSGHVARANVCFTWLACLLNNNKFYILLGKSICLILFNFKFFLFSVRTRHWNHRFGSGYSLFHHLVWCRKSVFLWFSIYQLLRRKHNLLGKQTSPEEISENNWEWLSRTGILGYGILSLEFCDDPGTSSYIFVLSDCTTLFAPTQLIS